MKQEGQTVSYVDLQELDTDPYPVFDRLREDAPVFWFEDAASYMVTRWDECERITMDHDAFRGPAERPSAMRAFGDPTILSMDGDTHKDMRAGVEPPLRPRQVNGYVDAMIRPIARAAVEGLRGKTETEIMSTYFEPVSVRSLGDLLGLQEVSVDTLRAWFFGIVSGLSNVTLVEEGFAASDQAGHEIAEVMRPKIERLTADPDGSALSRMIWDGRPPTEPRTAEELMPTLRVYLAGGMQEPGHGAGSTLLGLFTRPEQLARVVADPSLIQRAIIEGLRCIAPIGATQREAREPVELAGVTIQPGRVINVMLSAANRDPARFGNPHEYDLDRPEVHQMAFGGGRHFCAGHAFGRAVERIAFEELFQAFPGIAQHPDREPVVRGWLFRAPRELHVTLG